MEQIFPGVWRNEKRIFTQNLLPGDKTYSKSAFEFGSRAFREYAATAH